jgi:hypothetical protein
MYRSPPPSEPRREVLSFRLLARGPSSFLELPLRSSDPARRVDGDPARFDDVGAFPSGLARSLLSSGLPDACFSWGFRAPPPPLALGRPDRALVLGRPTRSSSVSRSAVRRRVSSPPRSFGRSAHADRGVSAASGASRVASPRSSGRSGRCERTVRDLKACSLESQVVADDLLWSAPLRWT